jgi:hypothetical protein
MANHDPRFQDAIQMLSQCSEEGLSVSSCLRLMLQFVVFEFRHLMNRLFVSERDPERRKDE